MNSNTQAQAPKKRTQWWFLLHSWLAMPIWLFLFFICLTGTIATVSQEIVWLFDSSVRANPPDNAGEMLTFDEVIEVVEREAPGAYVAEITRPVKSQFALTAEISYPDSTSENVFINPYTGEIQGRAASGFNFRQFVRAIHGWLLIPFNTGFTRYSFGWYMVSVLGIPMLLSLITGLVVYKKFWRGFLHPRLRVNRGARVFWGDFHRLAGIWSIPFILIISVTAIWFMIQGLLFEAGVPFNGASQAPVFVPRDEVPVAEQGRPPLITPDQAIAAVNQRYDNVEAQVLRLPGTAFGHYRVLGRSQAFPLVHESFLVNPYSGSIDEAMRVGDQPGLMFTRLSMRALHTGDFVGLSLKLVYFFFGVLLTMMVFSGMRIWMTRTFKTTQAAIRQKKARVKAIGDSA
ncbi:PepSY-associated TM helix domain-containing protein [Marinomonas ostreistagni]|uniref:PepSY-associated TM helix domain-containing protein n=1 Tax=Marinomonas ostreistagni TaxID=359209 RepID=UPI0019507D90|nr:PepSY-associated TM helix domain-containing protein [Marinomonas ostreistagni]MBM6550611.1 PepSY domain-containing protein [Marinomonas ostreistagni]